MADNATVIAAHLDDKDLKNSIDKLVQYVDDGTRKMAETFNRRVQSMRDTLVNTLGNVKLDNLDKVGNGETGAARRTRAQNEETAAVRRTKEQYDQLAKAKEIATVQSAQPKSARDSYLTFMKGYREQADKVQQMIDAMESKLVNTQLKRIHNLDVEIERINQKIKEVEHTPSSTRGKQIEDLRRQIESIRQLQDKMNNEPFWGQHTGQLDKLRAEHERIKNIMRDQTKAQVQQSDSQQQVTQAVQGTTNAYHTLLNAKQKAIEDEKQLRMTVADTGRAAQESLQQISQSIRTQLDLGTEKPIQGINELQRALVEMRRAYFDMDTAGRESPFGQALKRDIDRANSLITALNVYNKNLAGVSLGKNLSVDNSIGSYERLSNIVKELTTEYQRLGRGERNAIKGNELANKIQTFGRAVQKIQEQMSRPISLEKALGLSENTLSDISYKIRQLQAYKRGISLTDPNSQNEMKSVDGAINRLQTQLNTYTGTAQRATQANNALTRSWNYMKNRLAFYLTVGASTQFVRNLIEIRSQYEMNERALGVLINSAERGTQIFNQLSQMSLVSPYTLIELSSAAKQLVAYDVAAKDVVDTTRRLADMAAAVGTPIERLTYALGQIKAYGYLNSRDNRMFANAGIPLVKQLANYYTELEGKLVSTADVYDRIKKKAVGYNDVMSVIYKMTDEGGKFFDFQAKMAETLKVRLANLTLAWNNMLNEMGQETQGVLTTSIGLLRDLFANWRNIEKALKDIVIAFGVFKARQAIILLGMGALGRTLGWNVLIGKKLTSVFASMLNIVKAALINPATYAAALLIVLGDMYTSWRNNVQAVKEFNKEIAKGAKESADSIDKYLGASTSRETRQKASTGKLSQDAGQKAWENIAEQIETSSQNSAELIAKLSAIPDINERIAKSFDYLEQIRAVNMALEKLDDETLKFSKDSWHGVFGEGLASDLADYAEQMARVSKSFMDGYINKPTAINLLQPQLLEFKKELDVTTQSIKAFLDENQITAPEQVKEVLERVRAIIKQKNPEIKGELGDLFDISLDERMAELTNSAVDKNASLWRIFMEELKKSSSSAFQGLTEDIFDQTKALNEVLQPEQMRAIDDTLEKFKLKMPFFYDAVANMVKDASQLRINIGVAFGLDPNIETVYQLLTKADSAADTAWGKVQRLTKERDRLKALGATMAGTSENDKKLARTLSELSAAESDYHTALDEGGQSKKENAAATKAQKAAESELQKALKDEISILDKARSTYKSLTKEGVNSATAISEATSGYDDSLRHINSVLRKYGVAEFNLGDYVGVSNPQEIKDALQAQLDALKRSNIAKPSEIKDLEVKLKDLRIDSVTFNQKTLTDSLNNELGKIKEEYELAVELDANPELGNIFLDTLGISEEQMKEMPKTAEDAARASQDAINKVFEAHNIGTTFDLNKMLNRANFEEWVNQNGHMMDDELTKQLKNYVDFVNKVRLDETKKTLQEWDKLLDKYAEYETKRRRIIEESEHEISVARKKNANDEIIDAIRARRDRDLAQVDFERFQKTPDWIVATGDVANLTDKALGTLIKRLQEYKRNAKNLDPKQIKQINNALTKLYKEQRKGNPFAEIVNVVDEARDRFNDYQVAIEDVERDIDKLRKKQGHWTAEEGQRFAQLIKRLEEYKKAQKEVSEISAQDIVSGFQSATSELDKIVGDIKEIADAFGGSDLADGLSNVLGSLQNALTYAMMGAWIGGPWGAIIGGVVGLLESSIKTLAEELSGNADITRWVQASERVVRKLELAYKDLDYAIENASGSAVAGYQKLAIINKELQLFELERQLKLEESRKQKNRDEDKILEIQGQIKDLKHEITDAINEITNNFLGISSVGDAAENMVNTMIDALRNGKDALKSFNGSVDDMIANVVKKFVTTKYLTPVLDELWAQLEYVTNRKSNPIEHELSEIQRQRSDLLREMEYVKSTSVDVDWKKYFKPFYDDLLADYDKQISEQEKALLAASQLTDDDVNIMAELLQRLKQQASPIADVIESLLEKTGLGVGQDSSGLSALQQGIQGITETTANALEAYMNGISQQMYLHSALLTEIRDFLIPQDGDIQMDIQAQMLLQLQQSYQVQMSIQSILENWTNASGQAVRVELIA